MAVMWDKDQQLQPSLDLDMPLAGNAIPETYRIGCLSEAGFFLSEISRSLKQVIVEWKIFLIVLIGLYLGA
jgi:hypothetical protein